MDGSDGSPRHCGRACFRVRGADGVAVGRLRGMADDLSRSSRVLREAWAGMPYGR